MMCGMSLIKFTDDASESDDASKSSDTRNLLAFRPLGLNVLLRRDPNNAWARDRAGDIDEYLETLPIHKGECYRGINASDLPLFLVLGWHRAKSEYTDEAFTTASLSKNVAWKYTGTTPNHRVVMVIQSKTGRIVPPNVGSAVDEEISFKRGTKFPIRRSHTHDLFQPDQHMLLYAEEIEYDDDL